MLQFIHGHLPIKDKYDNTRSVMVELKRPQQFKQSAPVVTKGLRGESGELPDYDGIFRNQPICKNNVEQMELGAKTCEETGQKRKKQRTEIVFQKGNFNIFKTEIASVF